jgi:hypothetical protein
MKSRQLTPVGQECIAPKQPFLICCQCGLPKTPEEFRRRWSHSEVRIYQCRPCHATAERLRRRALRSRQDRKTVNRQLAQLKRAKSEGQVITVCEAMVAGFGGINGLRAAWESLLSRDLAKGGFSSLRHLEAVIRLVQHCESHRPDYSQLTDEQLQEMADRFGLC